MRRHGCNTTNIRQWLDLCTLYREWSQAAEGYTPNETLADHILKYLQAAPELHLPQAVMQTIANFASVYPGVKYSAGSARKMRAAVETSGAIGKDGWPDPEAMISTMRKSLTKDLYDKLKDPAFFKCYMTEQHKKGGISDEFHLAQGIPVDEDSAGEPVMRPSDAKSRWMQRAHEITHPNKRKQVADLVAAHQAQEADKAAGVRTQTSNLLQHNATMEEALIVMVRGRMRDDSQYARHPVSVPRKRMLSQASEQDFEDIIRASKVTAGQFRAFITSRKYKDTSRQSGFQQPSGNLHKASATQDKTLPQQAFQLRDSEVKMRVPAPRAALASPASSVASLPSVQVCTNILVYTCAHINTHAHTLLRAHTHT